MKEQLLQKLGEGYLTDSEQKELLTILHQRTMRLAELFILKKNRTETIKNELKDAMLEHRHIKSIITGVEFTEDWYLFRLLTK